MAKTVLYVEDEEFDFFFMRRAFQKALPQTDLRWVASGQDAIDYLQGAASFADRQAHPLPELVLLDLHLPVISGFEVLKWMRVSPQFQQVPVVVFSSSGRKEDRTSATELGANEYVLKPASGKDFVSVAQELKDRWLDTEKTPLPAEA